MVFGSPFSVLVALGVLALVWSRDHLPVAIAVAIAAGNRNSVLSIWLHLLLFRVTIYGDMAGARRRCGTRGGSEEITKRVAKYNNCTAAKKVGTPLELSEVGYPRRPAVNLRFFFFFF